MNSYEYENIARQAAIVGTLTMIVGIVLAVVLVVSMWKIFAKAGKPGWASIVPFYNLYVLYEISWGKGIYFLLLLVPFVNAFIGILTVYKLGQNFGKSTGFIIGMILLPIIFMPLLAFGDSAFIGVGGYGAPYADSRIIPSRDINRAIRSKADSRDINRVIRSKADNSRDTNRAIRSREISNRDINKYESCCWRMKEISILN